MKLDLSGRVAVGASLIVSLSVATSLGQQAVSSQPISATSFSVEETTIRQIHAAYLAGETTARAITQAYINRIVAYDKRGPYLNSIINLNDHALADADRLDAALKATGRLTGPLHGIPVIVKDNLDTFDLPTTSGVALFRDLYRRRMRSSLHASAKQAPSYWRRHRSRSSPWVWPTQLTLSFQASPGIRTTRLTPAEAQAGAPRWQSPQTSVRLALAPILVEACERQRQSIIWSASGRPSAS